MTDVLNDILMITSDRSDYTRLALSRLIETCDDQCRVWLWHNGTHATTHELVEEFRSHPAVHRFQHSPKNAGEDAPLRWVFEDGKGRYLSKVDDSSLMPHGWLNTLRKAHEENPEFGAVGCWPFPEDLLVPEVASRKIRRFRGGHYLMLNSWIEDSGFVLKRACIEKHGVIAKGMSFPRYCVTLAKHGWINGWYFPFLFQERLDHPWSERTMLKSDEDLEHYALAHAERWNVHSIEDYTSRLREEAYLLQKAKPDARLYTGWRGRARQTLQQFQPPAERTWSHPTPLDAPIKRFRDRYQPGLWLYYKSPWVNARFVSDEPMAVVGGAERSGTTLLRAALDSHPEVTMGPESWVFVYKLDLEFLSEEYGFPVSELEAMREQSSGLAEFISRFAQRCRDESNKPVWGEKSPQNVSRLSYIWKHFPQARFVHIIRDGRDVACSLRTHPKRVRIAGTYYSTNISRPIEECVDRWLTAVSAGIKHRGDPRYMEVRYEHLVADYARETRRIVEHLGVAWSDGLLKRQEIQQSKSDVEIVNPEVRGPLYSKAIARWRKDLSDTDRMTVEKRAGPLLRELGYLDV